MQNNVKKPSLKLPIILMTWPFAGIMVSIIIYAIINFTAGSFGDTTTSSASSVQNTLVTLSNVILFLIGAASIGLGLPSFIVGLVLLITRLNQPKETATNSSRVKAEAEKQEAKQEYLSQTNAITQLLIDQINDPSYSVDGSTPYYDYDSESGLLVFHSAERDSFLDSLTIVSISYRVADQETDLYNASADVLYTTVQSSQPARLEVYQDSSFGGTVNYIVMDVNGNVFYNHAFGEDGFENPYDNLPVTDIGYIQPTLDSAQKIVTNEGAELY